MSNKRDHMSRVELDLTDIVNSDPIAVIGQIIVHAEVNGWKAWIKPLEMASDALQGNVGWEYIIDVINKHYPEDLFGQNNDLGGKTVRAIWNLEKEREAIMSGFLIELEKKQAINERLQAFEALGREPEELQRMIDMLEDPAPMPMLPDDEKEFSGLLEDDDLDLMPGVEATYVINDWEGGL